MTAIGAQPHYRTIWISDLHLGTRGCQADFLLDFLNRLRCRRLYLVGDIVDGWRLRKSWYWPDSHHAVLLRLMDMARSGTEVIFVPGNHDEIARDFTDMVFGHITVRREVVHRTADGKNLLVIHGDEFDGVVRYAKWLARLGDGAYTLALALNRHFNTVRRRLGYPYWSLSAFLKHRVKNAVQFISDFETALAEEARRRHVDGVVCGHIHHAEIRDINGILYCNDGDWVESCTALAEHGDGRLELIHWAAQRHSLPGVASPTPVSRPMRARLSSLFRTRPPQQETRPCASR